MTFLVIDGTRHWPSTSNLFYKTLKRKDVSALANTTFCLFLKSSKAVSAFLIGHNMRNIFLQNYAENEAGKLVPHFLFLKKLFMSQKQVISTLASIHFGSPRLGQTIKTNS